jgi:hypothetical protein
MQQSYETNSGLIDTTNINLAKDYLRFTSKWKIL